jgi:diketogulonate reductase-like aldo/keto reductase
LIHNPYCQNEEGCEGTWRETWKAMEDVYLLGLNQKSPKIKSIGVSNFNEKELIELLHFARVKPFLVQNRHDPLHTDW